MRKFSFADLIISESEDYIIINKPPFVSTLEDRNAPFNILDLSKTYFSESQVCHRLDKETSGALAIAKNANAYRHLSMQFEKRAVAKLYEAVVEGIHNFRDQQVNAPISVLSRGIARIDRKAGKRASTLVSVKQAFRSHSLVECRPETGRLHQIRIHLALLGAPIVGDLQYGGRHLYLSSLKQNYNLKKDTEELPLIKRVALHACSLGFADLNGREQSFTAEYPKDFAVLLRQLKRQSS